MADDLGSDLGPLVGARETGFVEWKPKNELMAPLLEMGLSENSAKRVNLIISAISENCSTTIVLRPLNYFVLKWVACCIISSISIAVSVPRGPDLDCFFLVYFYIVFL